MVAGWAWARHSRQPAVSGSSQNGASTGTTPIVAFRGAKGDVFFADPKFAIFLRLVCPKSKAGPGGSLMNHAKQRPLPKTSYSSSW